MTVDWYKSQLYVTPTQPFGAPSYHRKVPGLRPHQVRHNSGEDLEGKQIARDLEQRLYEEDLKAASGDIKEVANRQNPIGIKNPNRDKYLAAADEYLKIKRIH